MTHRIFWLATLIAGLSVVLPAARAQGTVVQVSGCELAAQPKAYDGKMIQVRGAVNVHFEDFTLDRGKCESGQGIWLSFGGDVPGIVPSTANDNLRKRGTELQIEGVSYGVKKDDSFREFYALIAARHGEKADYRVTATLTGKFLAGAETKTANGRTAFQGYGHLGCCSLLVIMAVSDVKSVPKADLRLHGVVVGADKKPLVGVTVINDVLGGSPPERQTAVTNERGEFAFSNAGQQLRIEDPRYRPQSLTVEPGGAAVRVTLREAQESDWIVPTCTEGVSTERVGFSAMLQLPPSMQSSTEKYEDHESIFVYNRGEEAVAARLIISRSLGEEFHEPNSQDWDRFEERWMKDSKGKVIGLDARGAKVRGDIWRAVVLTNGETIGYWVKGGEQGRLDGIINSACMSVVDRQPQPAE